FGRDESRHRRAEAFTVGERGFGALELLLAAEVLALGDIDHFLGDDTGPRPFELGEVLSVKRPPGLRRVGEIACEMLASDIAVVNRLDLAAFVFLDPASLLNPFNTGPRQSLLDVDRHLRISVRTSGVVDRQWRLARRSVERDLAQGYAQIGRGLGLRVDLARGRQRARRDFRSDKIGASNRLVHDITPERKPK